MCNQKEKEKGERKVLQVLFTHTHTHTQTQIILIYFPVISQFRKHMTIWETRMYIFVEEEYMITFIILSYG